MQDFFSLIYYKIRQGSFLIFLITLILGYFAEQGLDYLVKEQGTPYAIGIVLLVVAVPILYLILQEVVRCLKPPLRAIVGQQPSHRKGMIFIFSNEDVFFKAIEYHNIYLAHIWVVVTKETKKKFEAVQIPQRHIKIHLLTEVEDPWSSDQAERAVRHALEHIQDYNLSRREVICDITGGLTAMKVGAIRACLEADIDMQMVPAEYDEELKRPRPRPPIQIEI